MAKLPALIDTLAVFHPNHEPTAIRYAARALRVAEPSLLSAGSSGRGAPEMTARDAMNLLLALNLAEDPRQYANAALLGASLSRPDDKAPHPTETPNVVVEVMLATTLGHALHVLITRAEELSAPRVRTDPFVEPNSDLRRDEGPGVEVQLVRHGDDVLARVAMFWKSAGGHRRAERQYGARSGKPAYGRWTSVHFDQALFLALKRTIVADPPWAFAAEPARR